MSIKIRSARIDDLEAYTKMMQATYEDAYVDESIGLTKEWLSMAIFTTSDSQEYLKSLLVNNEQYRSWLATDGNEIVGGVVAEIDGDMCHMGGFYVHPAHQGRGIGKMLWNDILEFADEKDIYLDIYTHNKKTIALYEHWGFEEDTSRARFFRHWTDWPDHLQAESMYMIRRGARLT